MSDEEERGYWEVLKDKLIDKLNNLLKDSSKIDALSYFFEPITGEEEEGIFNFTNPFKKLSVKFRWSFWSKQEEKPELLDKHVDAQSLQEMINALDHVEQKSRNKSTIITNSPHWDPSRGNEFPFEDFYETDNQYIVGIEIPPVTEEDIEIRGTPVELEIKIGDSYHRIIQIDEPVNPDSAETFYDGKGLLEIKFRKLNPEKIKI